MGCRCIREPDDAIDLFRNMLRMHPPPSVFDFTKLLTAVVKMQQYSLALHLFDVVCVVSHCIACNTQVRFMHRNLSNG
ncbi:putative pentatricopeptide repeat-containing protein, mitochondrial [Salvia divinorum]|uniref:Pentatricopeptide repeat-containing protein, mitochondrial n=1 Tax=Salvia divinorum TaxID=28513 RepID=A0ABD1FWX0_SALDI